VSKIKLRETVRDVKTFDRAKNLARHTKQTAEKQEESRHSSPGAYAADTVSDGARCVANRAQNSLCRRPIRRTRRSVQNVKKAADNARNAFRQVRTAPKKAVNSAGKTIRTSAKTVKTAGRTTVKTAQTAGKTVKTAATATKTTAKSAVAAAKAAKLAALKAKVAAMKVKLIIKALVATVKLAIAAIKALVALLVAGGWIAVLILVIIAMIGLLLASPFGIFFSGEDSSDTELSMQGIVTQLTTEFFAEIDEIAARNPHDELRRSGMTIRWNEVLSVYAVRVATDPEHGMDVVTLDEARIDQIRNVLHDMVRLSYSLRAETRERMMTDEDGNEWTESVSVTVLVITLNHRTPDDMAALYDFDTDRQEMLRELLGPAYLELWAMLLGGHMAGDGRVLVGNESFIPLGMFAWPLEGNWPISSRFGPRRSPGGIGSTNHQGIDIAAPGGTPILAAADGIVVQSFWNGGFGNFILIDHGGGYRTAYAHNSRNIVSTGDRVVQGQVIGYVGTTGNSTGNHLHFEIRRNGVPVDPLLYFTW